MSEERGRVAFTPLCDCGGDSASCFLLEIDRSRLLLDCGWDRPFDPQSLAQLQEVAQSVDVVLLSHSDTSHLGAFPYAFSKLGLRAKALCTLPVSKMGQMFLYDTVLSLQAESNFSLFTLDEIDAAFAQIITLKYNEEFLLEEHGLIITARNAGHMVGGAAWVISKEMHNIVYVVDYNHKREKHLNGLHFESFKRPSLLITESKHIFRPVLAEDEQLTSFLTSITQTLRGGGNVLIPTDTAGRVLELVLILEDYWLKNKLAFPLVLLGSVAYSTISFASCQLEWMHASIAAAFERERDNPFDCRCVRFCNHLEDLEKLGDGPKVVLASSPSLDTGFAKQLAVEWVQDKNSVIILTQKPQKNTLGASLQAAKEAEEKEMTVSLSQRVALTGQELEDYETDKLMELSSSPFPGVLSQLSTISKCLNHFLVTGDNTENDELSLVDITGDEGEQKAPGITRGLSIEKVPESETKHYVVSGVLCDGFVPSEDSKFAIFPFDPDQENDFDVFGVAFCESDIFNLQTNKEDQSLLTGAPLVLDDEVPEIPSKIITTEMEIKILGSILSFDFSASTNMHFLQHFISYICPRNLILVNGSNDCHRTMSEEAKNGCPFLKGTNRVACPGKGEKVELVDRLGCFGVVVDVALMKSLDWKESQSAKVAWIEGRIEEIKENAKDGLVLMPHDASNIKTASSFDGLFVGDGRLSTIKGKLESIGMKTHFHEGKLTCNDTIKICMTPQATINLEGPLSTDYYLIRQAIDDIYRIL